MTSPDPHSALDVLRKTGAALKQTFNESAPISEPKDMMAAFHRLDGPTSDVIQSMLADAYPDIGWLDGEFNGTEAWQRALQGSYWVCDAIDGAVQFLRAIPQWCLSLTLIRDGEAVFAAVYDAMHDHLFHAIAGQGAFLNGQPIHVNTRNTFVNGFVATSQPPFVNDDVATIDSAGRSLSAVLAKAGAVRNLGPTSLQLAYVACGRLDAFWEFGEDTFNCLAGALLVREAGGHVTDVHGETYRMRSASIVAASCDVHASLVEVLKNV